MICALRTLNLSQAWTLRILSQCEIPHMVRQRRMIPNNQGLFQRKLNLFSIKVLVLHIRNSFCIFSFLFTLHTFTQSFVDNIRWGPSPYLHSCGLSERNIQWVPSRDSNSGLPYSSQRTSTIWATLHPLKIHILYTWDGDREESGWKRENAVE